MSTLHVPPAMPSAVADAPAAVPAFPRGVHVPVLDGVRGLAVLLVLLRHFTMAFTPRTEAGELVQLLARAGWSGVDLFFVLSGFLITGILVDSQANPRYYRNFFVRRALRIFPLYYGVLAALFLVLPLVVAALGRSDVLAGSADYAELRAHQGWYWLYLTNVLAAREGFDALTLHTSHFWSLAVEEQFYLVWPFLVRGRTPRQLVWMCVGVIMLASLFRAVVLSGGASDVAVYTLTPARLDALGAGALVAVLARNPTHWAAMVRAAPATLAVCGALVVATVVHRDGLSYGDPSVQISGFARLAILFAALIVVVIAAPEGRVGRLFDRRWLRWFGQYSYGIYVFHFPLLFIAQRVTPPADLPVVFGTQLPAHALYTLALTGASAGVAGVSWHAFEKHFLRLKARFPSDPGGPRARRTADHGAGGVEGVPGAPARVGA